MKAKKIRTIRLKKNETINIIASEEGQHAYATNGCSHLGGNRLIIKAKTFIPTK